jgi:hypothetical protein
MARWRVYIIKGKRAEYLGVVSAPNESAALAAAIKLFRIPPAAPVSSSAAAACARCNSSMIGAV